MIDGLKPYPAMKESGVRWLGDVPEHWESASVKRHYAIQLGKMLQNRLEGPRDVEVPYLKAQHVQWFAVRTSAVPRMWASPRDLEQYGVAVGDLLVCEGGEGGRCGIVRDIEAGHVIQNALHRARPLGQCLNQFLQYVMSAVSATGWFEAINSKATIAHFTRQKFGALGMPVPPAPEQAAIVRFLDYADRRIRRYIRAKQKLIKLLDEQKQVIIHQAVTRGLDPNVRLKPSGVEWWGDVPEKWEVRRLGRIARVFNGTTPSRFEPAYWHDGTIPWLSSGKVNDYVVLTPSELVTERALQECSISVVPKGAVIIGLVGQGKTRGKSAFLGIDACINQNLAAIIPLRELDGRYLHHFLTAFYKVLREYGRGGNQEALNCEIVANFRVSVPTREEQRKICVYIETSLVEVERAERRINQEISLLRDYRTRLIADVVTGKLDVREAAAKLPDEVPEAEPLDEIEDVLQDESVAEDIDIEAADAA